MDENAPNFAPGPYSTIDVGGGSGFHTYVADCSGRKIAAVWGPHAQKVWTAALFAAAPDLLEALRDLVALCRIGDEKTEARRRYDAAYAAIAKAEGR